MWTLSVTPCESQLVPLPIVAIRWATYLSHHHFCQGWNRLLDSWFHNSQWCDNKVTCLYIVTLLGCLRWRFRWSEFVGGKDGFGRLRATPDASRNAFAVRFRGSNSFRGSLSRFRRGSLSRFRHNVSHKCIRKHLLSYSLIYILSCNQKL